ncbi:PTS sugar transporter subunit IIA [Burkholderia anthina]|uniref:PTS sugar transporter subunit IIA n=1 Tax=Burkholderia anthina TaxID=179879 RepID=UPI00158ADDF3
MQTQQAANGGHPTIVHRREHMPFAPRLADVCPPERILLDAPVESASQLFDLVAHHIAHGTGFSADTIKAELAKREQLGSTALGQGVAIPHARIDGFGAAVALFVRAQYPFSFDAPDRKPVRKFIVLVMPKEGDRDALELLADAARCFGERAFRHASRDALTPVDIHRLMQPMR